MQHVTLEIVIDYIHRELAPERDAEVLAHLSACPECTREFEAEAKLSDYLRSAAKREELEPPPAMRAAIMAELATMAPGPFERLSAWLRPIVLIPLTGALAVAAAFVIVPMQHAGAQPLPVAYMLEEHAAHTQENPLSDRSAAAMMPGSNTVTTASFANDQGPVTPVVQMVDSATFANDGAR